MNFIEGVIFLQHISKSILKEKLNIKSIIQTFNTWPRMYKLLWNTNKLYFITIIALAIITGLIPASMIYVMEALVNTISDINLESFNIIFTLALLYLGLIVFSSFLDSYSEVVKSVYQEMLLKEINIKIIDKATKIPYIYFENHETYDNIQRSRDESTYRPFQIFEQTIGIISGVVTLASVSSILILWNWWTLLILMVIPILSAYSFLKLGRQEYLVSFFQAHKRRILFYLTHLMTKDYHIKEIKTFNKTDIMKKKYEEKYKVVFSENKEMTMKRFKISITFDLLTIFIVGTIILFIVWQAYLGLIAIGSFVAYIQAINRTQSNLSGVTRLCFSLYENNLYIEQLFNFYYLPEEGHQSVNKKMPKGDSTYSLKFENVSFTYPSRNEHALKEINFTFLPNEIVAIVGENGSGKSTLTKLICKLFHPSDGCIYYNGIPLSDYDPEDWKQKLSVVFQEFNKYEFTARENITLGGNEHSIEDVKKAAHYSGASQFIDLLPEKYDSQLGVQFSGGVQLSGGQWQKIAISRAFIRDVEIYVFDEPTASIDGLSQEKIFNNFKKVCQSKIGIFVSHRLSNITHADKIIVMKDGKIDDIGEHFELMKKRGLYYRLYQSQVNEDTKEKNKSNMDVMFG